MNFNQLYEKMNSELPALSPEQNLLRQKSLNFLNQQGLPTRKKESWKYTSLKFLSEYQFFPAAQAQMSDQTRALLIKQLDPDHHHIVFFNGHWVKDLSFDSVSGIQLSLRSPQSAGLEGDETFKSLNDLGSPKELCIEVKANQTIEKPIHISYFVHLQGGGSLLVSPRFFLKVEKNAEVCVVESFIGLEPSRYFVNSYAKIKVDADARLQFVTHQNQSLVGYQVAQNLFELDQGAQLKNLSFQAGALLSRHHVEVHHLGKNSSSESYGLSLQTKEQHVDHAVLVHHHVGETTSKQLYKSLLDQRSRSVFTGKIKIAKEAQKSSAEQLNNNLLLSSTAEVDSQPQLEIEADDVKANHGSTVGQLNPDEIFYLKSRAISEKHAIELLSFGFLAELIDSMSPRLQPWLKGELQSTFHRLDQIPSTRTL